jgi:hypothetical protein
VAELVQLGGGDAGLDEGFDVVEDFAGQAAGDRISAISSAVFMEMAMDVGEYRGSAF